MDFLVDIMSSSLLEDQQKTVRLKENDNKKITFNLDDSDQADSQSIPDKYHWNQEQLENDPDDNKKPQYQSQHFLQSSKSLKILKDSPTEKKSDLRKAKSYIDLISNTSKELHFGEYEDLVVPKERKESLTKKRSLKSFDSYKGNVSPSKLKPDVLPNKNRLSLDNSKPELYNTNSNNKNTDINYNGSDWAETNNELAKSNTFTSPQIPSFHFKSQPATSTSFSVISSPRKKNRVHTILHNTDGMEKHQRKLVKRDRHRPSPSDANFYYTQRTIESDSISVLPSSTGIDPLSDYVSSDFHNSGSINGSEVVYSHPQSAIYPPKIYSRENTNIEADKFLSLSQVSLLQDDDNTNKLDSNIFISEIPSDSFLGYNKDTSYPKNKSAINYPLNTTDNDNISSHYNHIFSPKSNDRHSTKKHTKFSEIYSNSQNTSAIDSASELSRSSMASKKEGNSPSVWQAYCKVVTFFAPASILCLCGMNSKSRQQAWREKIGLLSVIFLLTNFVGFFTFAFNAFVCGKPIPRVHYKDIPYDSAIVHGSLYNISTIIESAARHHGSTENLPKYLEIWEYSGGADASLLFQNVNGPCSDYISADIDRQPFPMTADGQFSNYFPCVLLNLNGSPRSNPLQTRIIHRPNGFGFESGGSIDNMQLCHLEPGARDYLYRLGNDIDVYYLWDDLANVNNDVVVYLGDVIDLTRLLMLRPFKLAEPLNSLLNNGTLLRGTDISYFLSQSQEYRQAARCLIQLAKVGVIDTDTLGCIASNIVLIISLTFIISIIVVKFVFALYFEWFLSWRLGANIEKVPLPIASAAHSVKSAASNVSNIADSLDRVVKKYVQSRKNAKIALDGPSLNGLHRYPDIMIVGDEDEEDEGNIEPESFSISTGSDKMRETCNDENEVQSTNTVDTGNSLTMSLDNLNKAIASELMGETLIEDTDSVIDPLNNLSSSDSKFKAQTQAQSILPTSQSNTHVINIESLNETNMQPISISLSSSSLEDITRESASSVNLPVEPLTNNTTRNFNSAEFSEKNNQLFLDGTTKIRRIDSNQRTSASLFPKSEIMTLEANDAKVATSAVSFVSHSSYSASLLNTICLVTAYSESEEGLRSTLDSIAISDYPTSHKLIIVVCDGLIIGSGNTQSTPEIAVSMITDFLVPPSDVALMPYIAVAHGAKRYNLAKIYAGHYKYKGDNILAEYPDPVPIVCIVKCGDEWERDTPGVKPGNRGKRDSQVLLMSFLQRIMFNERMTDFEHALYYTIWQLTKKDVMDYEAVLMVDADTRIQPDSIQHMVSCLVKDPMIMGICGETQIANKTDTWVTMIQVFEYFISHHLTKSFESVFGGVTCLPGCFSIYRIKAPKGPKGYWVPILANPDVVERYAVNCVETLHQKNLLLLGEDRYLSTLMLKTFPTRKQIFVPQAKCETIAPSEFGVLLDQRRRWINSTVHNLMELIIVRDLCGVFCISMQFVVLIEFIGTLTLPAALLFTFFVVARAIVETPMPVVPLVLLGLIIGIPGLLIVVTAHHWVYVLWMVVYLISLPIWNFILPLNACK